MSKNMTRAKAEAALSTGESPEGFVDHPNYHVRLKAWKKMGKPLPENGAEVDVFLAKLFGKDPKDIAALGKEAADQTYAQLRQRAHLDPIPDVTSTTE